MSPSAISPRLNFTTFHNIINSEPRSSSTFHQGTNPATSEKLWDVPVATKSDLDDAVNAARSAFPSWSKTPIEERKRLVVKWSEVYMGYEKEFTDLLVTECGKPRMFANGEVTAASDYIVHHSKLYPPRLSMDCCDSFKNADPSFILFQQRLVYLPRLWI